MSKKHLDGPPRAPRPIEPMRNNGAEPQEIPTMSPNGLGELLGDGPVTLMNATVIPAQETNPIVAVTDDLIQQAVMAVAVGWIGKDPLLVNGVDVSGPMVYDLAQMVLLDLYGGQPA